ncbi:unnamed protein product [Phytophthora fragariaefolia]|uniref:Unnamed protein product n=1 Tax=Phytophthora fragariaefolia TaxID=1490495 RepID=A0A9W6WXM0_9STRA|nr:unnamed protein product [Phytophthora fragariaefolia]
MKPEEDCHITHVKPPTDNGAPLAQCLKMLKATTVEVAANGHCGWLAFYAALYNLNMGLVNISNEVAEGANILKKRVLNSMIANIVEEMPEQRVTRSEQQRLRGWPQVMSSLPRQIAGVGANKKTNKNKKRNGQGSINDYFRVQTTDEWGIASRIAFRRFGRQVKRTRRRELRQEASGKAKQHKQDCTIGVTTLNVRGLASHMRNLGGKPHGLKEQHQRGDRDFVFIQETHLHPAEHEAGASQHVAMWGFNHTTAQNTQCAAMERRALDRTPRYGYGRDCRENVLFINIYAPVHGAVRIQFFRKLLQLNLPTEVEIICGGDFNGVPRNGLDRIGGSRKSELGIIELEGFAAKHTLWDAGYYNLPKVNGNKERRKYAGACHTHFHTATSGRKGSSRLDRFYVSAASKPLVRGVATEESLCRSAHRAVRLELHSPKGNIRVKRSPKPYPPPAFVQAATTSLIDQTITEMGVRITEKPNQSSITEWESLKSGLRTKMTTLEQEDRRRKTSGFRQGIQRIKGQLVQLDAEGQEEGNTRADLLEALMQIQETRRGLQWRVLVANHALSAKASTRRFFRRGAQNLETTRFQH